VVILHHRTYHLRHVAGKLSLGKSKYISKKKQLNYSLLRTKGLISGVIYQDGQFDDHV
jgi:glycerol-3-phosphate dehydrogenase